MIGEENMARLIDVDTLLKELRKSCEYHAKNSRELSLLQRDIIIVQEQPTIEAEPVRHGKWRFVNCATGLRCQCSECLHWVDAGTDKNYCPNCGARMDEE